MLAAIALILASVGLYALTAYGVTQRTREIGLRVALGAQARDVVWMFVRRTLMQLAYGLPVGLAGAFVIGRLLQFFLVGTGPSDPVTLLSVIAVLVIITMAACLLPSSRAARIDPATSLRHD